MSGYIGSKSSVTLVDGYNQTEADAEFVAKAGDTMSGNLSFGDNTKAIFGAGSDLQIYSDGTHSRIYESGSGLLIVRASNFNVNNADGTDSYITMQDGGAVTAYYDGSAKLATTSTGIDVTGTVTADGLHVNSGAVNTAAKFESSDAIVSVELKDSTGSAYLNSTGGNLYTGNNVGIGTGSPAARLHVDNGSGSAFYVGLANNIYSRGAEHIWQSQNNASEYMRISSSNLLVGTTSQPIGGSTGKLGITTGTTAGTSVYVTNTGAAAHVTQGNSANNYFFGYFKNNSGTNVGSINVTSSSTAYNTSSDYRLKTDAQPMTGASARVQALNPVNFEWIADGTRVDGFLAHEAATVVPESVTGTKDAMRDEEYEVTPAVYEDVVIEAVLDDEGNELEAERTEQNLVTEAVMGTRSVPAMQGIDQSKMVPLLTAALQEALNKIDTMETRLAALEGN